MLNYILLEGFSILYYPWYQIFELHLLLFKLPAFAEY